MCGQESDGDKVPWKRRTRSPKRKWLDNIRNHLLERELSGDETQCRINSKRIIGNIESPSNVKGRQFLFT